MSKKTKATVVPGASSCLVRLKCLKYYVSFLTRFNIHMQQYHSAEMPPTIFKKKNPLNP
jgi:hypothetical protein